MISTLWIAHVGKVYKWIEEIGEGSGACATVAGVIGEGTFVDDSGSLGEQTG